MIRPSGWRKQPNEFNKEKRVKNIDVTHIAAAQAGSQPVAAAAPAVEL